MTRARGGLVSLLAGGSVILVLAPEFCGAQLDPEILADLRECSSLERDRARLACFDGVLATEPAAAEPTAATSHGEARADDSHVSASGTSTVAATTAGAPSPALPSDQGELTARSVAVPSRDATTASSPPRNERGSASRAAPAPAQDEAARTVMIVDLNASRPGAARFVTAAGEVLVQTSGGTPRGGFPEVPFEASLEDGAFGSLFLGVSERRRVRVKWAD